MKTLKKIMNLVPLMILWLMMSVFVWSWIFTFLTDAPREEKIVLFIECSVPGDTYIASMLEEYASEPIRLVQVRPFSYSMMSSNDIRNADLYIVSESGIHEYLEWFAPLPKSAGALGEVFPINGTDYGIKVYDAQSHTGIWASHIAYEDENYYLVFGKHSLHLAENENALSNEAIAFAKTLFKLDESKEVFE